jgi:hypothetical protein
MRIILGQGLCPIFKIRSCRNYSFLALRSCHRLKDPHKEIFYIYRSYLPHCRILDFYDAM